MLQRVVSIFRLQAFQKDIQIFDIQLQFFGEEIIFLNSKI